MDLCEQEERIQHHLLLLCCLRLGEASRSLRLATHTLIILSVLREVNVGDGAPSAEEGVLWEGALVFY